LKIQIKFSNGLGLPENATSVGVEPRTLFLHNIATLLGIKVTGKIIVKMIDPTLSFFHFGFNFLEFGLLVELVGNKPDQSDHRNASNDATRNEFGRDFGNKPLMLVMVAVGSLGTATATRSRSSSRGGIKGLKGGHRDEMH
jgi:hypothetical protein